MHTGSQTIVRPATDDDVPSAAQLLADAFSDYPWTRWAVAADDHAHRLRELHATFLAAIAIPYATVHVAQLPHEGLGACAVWMPSDAAVPPKVREHVGATAVDLSGDRAAAAEAAEAVLAPHRPTIAHVSLATVGVRPDLQGCGLGTSLLVAGLQAVDRAQRPAHLETSAPGNVRLYQRHGFVVTAVVDLPDGGPRTWSMLRQPVRR